MDQRRFVLATRNDDKVREIQHILMVEEWELLSLQDFPKTDKVEEDGKTFLDNALKKAHAAFDWTGIASLADDSGLEVNALRSDPGVLSSRFAGENASDHENNEKLLNLLTGVPEKDRKARFRCVVALVDDKEERWVEGFCEGMILQEYRGEGGFGYDPVFYVPDKGKTFAEMSEEEKNTISHRRRAFRKMAKLIKEYDLGRDTIK